MEKMSAEERITLAKKLAAKPFMRTPGSRKAFIENTFSDHPEIISQIPHEGLAEVVALSIVMECNYSDQRAQLFEALHQAIEYYRIPDFENEQITVTRGELYGIINGYLKLSSASDIQLIPIATSLGLNRLELGVLKNDPANLVNYVIDNDKIPEFCAATQAMELASPHKTSRSR